MAANELDTYLSSLQRSDEYHVVKTLGSSPIGTTELVSHGSDGLFVRKTINRELGVGSAYQHIYQAQQQGIALPAFPEIVECYSTESSLVAITRYVQGESLTKVAQQEGFGLSLAHQYFSQICEAINTLHTLFSPPLIHRDIKPDNIVISAGHVYLIDFDISRCERPNASTDTRHFGTRTYAPPEQYGFAQTDIRSDVFSLGILLAYCLTGSSLLAPEQWAKSLAKLNLAKEQQEALLAVLKRATALDPAQRYASALELSTQFYQVIQPRTRSVAAKAGRFALDAAIILTGMAFLFLTIGSAQDGAGNIPAWFNVAESIFFFDIPFIYLAVPLFDPHPLRASDFASQMSKRHAFMKKWFKEGLAVVGVGIILAIILGQFV